ncbi:MAG: hypothetical protein LKK13_00080 [Bacilli bacterium]|jgi:hypothetical protein|nr:hypothetical protein [Bacilli bacterium]
MKETPRKKLKGTLGGILAIAMAAFVSLNAVSALAAYLSISRDFFSADYRTDEIGDTYFSGGGGTSEDPYLIDNAQNLRNLQKLNALGLFSSATCFSLGSSFVWDDAAKPLLPIGSDDQPFDGTFNGQGNTITSLVVDGDNTWDVGMFGYVGINGTIENFFLDAPTIYLGANDGGGSSATTNPLDVYLKSAAQALPEPQGKDAGTGLTWTNASASSTISGLQQSVSASIGGTTRTFPIDWKSSDPSLLSENADGTWSTHANGLSENPDTDLYQVMLTGRVYGRVDGQVMPYTLERYEVVIYGNGLITDDTVSLETGTSSAATTVTRGMFKTIWPLDGNGADTEYHSIYVGFFCGHLDGMATYLGLVGGNSASGSANGKIVVSGRIAESRTCLIGRCRGDDVRDGTGSNQFGHTYDFTKNTDSWTAIEAPTQGAYTDPSQFSAQNTAAQSLNAKYGVESASDTYKYLRLYPSVTHGAVSYDYEGEDGSSQTASDVRTLTFSHALQANTYTAYHRTNFAWPTSDLNGDGELDQNDIPEDEEETRSDVTRKLRNSSVDNNMNLAADFALNNGIWISTKGANDDVMNTLMGNNVFTLNFRITYVASTSNPNKTANSWQILYNNYNPHIARLQITNFWGYLFLGSYYAFIYKDSPLQNLLWFDLHHPMTTTDDSTFAPVTENGANASYYTPVPIVADGSLQEANVSVTVDRNSSFWTTMFTNWLSNDTWYPCFAIGAGKTDSLSHGNTAFDYWSTTSSQRGLPNTNDQFFHDSFALDGDLNLNLLSFQCIFTNANGNITDLMSNVDYIYDKADCVYDASAGTFSDWNRSSGVKVSFDVTTALTSGNSTYYFYREVGNGGINSTVHALYSNANYKPANDDNYQKADIEAVS